LSRISREEYDRYNEGVDAFLLGYEIYLREAWAANLLGKRTINFQIEIANSGTSPADDVDVHLHFPDGFTLSTEGPELPEPPRPPHPPMTASQMLSASLGYSRMPFIPPVGTHFTTPGPFSIKRTNSYDVDDHFLRIKHGDSVMLPEMFVLFDSFEEATSFSCQYTIRPANLPEALSGELHFVVSKNVEAS
jgi:hypothetical protein